MGEHTNIAWCHSTLNPWEGCEPISPACDGCYAWSRNERFHGGNWGPHAPRRVMSDENWRKPHVWNRKALANGQAWRVFCGSLCDVFDNKAPEGQHDRLWKVIRETRALTWLLLTKRPQNIRKFLPRDLVGAEHIWHGFTAENQEELERRAPVSLAIDAPVHFMSCEPLLEELDARPYLGTGRDKVSWAIAGGGSDQPHLKWYASPLPQARVRALRDQARAAGSAFFMKQVGSNHEGWSGVTGKGESPEQWPEDLRIREFPEARITA